MGEVREMKQKSSNVVKKSSFIILSVSEVTHGQTWEISGI